MEKVKDDKEIVEYAQKLVNALQDSPGLSMFQKKLQRNIIMGKEDFIAEIEEVYKLDEDVFLDFFVDEPLREDDWIELRKYF